LQLDGRQGDKSAVRRYRLVDDASVVPGNMEWSFTLAPISTEDV
jgi:hypothetical protein